MPSEKLETKDLKTKDLKTKGLKTDGLTRRQLLAAAGIGGAALLLAEGRARADEQEIAPLDLNAYKLVFDENFDTLDVSSRGPGTRWIAHTPWNGDFGDATFSDPRPSFPFTVDKGILRIEARKTPDGWRSGLLCSADATGGGFSQQYGYFEASIKLPAGPGLWPGFWLNTMVPKGSPDDGVEIDVLEQYGQFPHAFESHVTVWPRDKSKARSLRKVQDVRSGLLSEGFHTYGVRVEPDYVTMYLDGIAFWHTPTPAEHKNKLMILINLAMGSGWPIDRTPNPSYMYVDYIRAYAKH